MVRRGTTRRSASRALRGCAPLLVAALFAGLALLAVPVAAQAQALEQKLIASDGQPNDFLGSSVAVDGDTAVVGAPGDDAQKGAVYVFTRSGDSWTQTAKLTASDGAGGDSLGASVAVDGDTIVAGAYGHNVGANDNQGAVYTFARTGAAVRQETATLTASDGAGGDQLGLSVAVDGDTIVAGAPFDAVGAIATRGSAYTFARAGGDRTQTAKLTASDGAADDRLGTSVAVDGDTIVAGAPFDDVGANPEQGSVYTFARTGLAVRSETAKLTASDGTTTDFLGWSVAVDGDTIVAGANGADVGTNDFQGAVYTFARAGLAARQETAKLTASDGAATDLLGGSVAVEGDTIVAGAQRDDIGANADQGSAYTFARTGGDRTQTAKLTASDGAADDQLGTSVAVEGDTIVAGAAFDGVGANSQQGSASIFFAAASTGGGGTEGPSGSASCSDGVDNDGDGQIDAADAGCTPIGGGGGGTGTGTEGPAGSASCGDGVDNDGDGRTDAADSGCTGGGAFARLTPNLLRPSASARQVGSKIVVLIRGRMVGNGGRPCEGRLKIGTRAGGRRVVTRIARMGSNCRYAKLYTFPVKRLPRRSRRGSKKLVLNVSVRYQGNAGLNPDLSPTRPVKVRR